MTKYFRFSKRSEDGLQTLHPQLQLVARHALKISRVDFTIISARRTIQEQRKLVAQGKSKTMRSRHLKGEALDFAPIHPTTGKGVFDRNLAIEVAVAFMDAGQTLECPVKWGGMWLNFEDIPHIEMIRHSPDRGEGQRPKQRVGQGYENPRENDDQAARDAANRAASIKASRAVLSVKGAR